MWFLKGGIALYNSCNRKKSMPQVGSKSLTVKDKTTVALELLRAKLGLRSWPEVVDYLVEKELRRFR